MDPDPTLTEAAVRDLSRPQSYDRGENYYAEDTVVDVVRRGEMIRAAVEGSQYEPYQVRIDLNGTGIVDTACSCPYDHGGICKHRVAVLLMYIRNPDEIDQRPPVSELVADADLEDLRDVLTDLVESRPELAEHVESRLKIEKPTTVVGRHVTIVPSYISYDSITNTDHAQILSV